ncbi:hypothetical protein ACFFHF_22110 [Robertmurraya beringensis]|uniref:Lipopolysaccharide biosynthesis protein n=1 Tax=Robertmurraya beringensis TaxID=641660 RepID=A0ABV6L0M9_9BACI
MRDKRLVDCLIEEKNKFVFYQYLQYFWRKKWFFLIVPVISTIIIIAAVYFLTKDKPYSGEILFYTGSITSQELVHPNNISSKYGGDVHVTEKGQVKFNLSGDSKEEVQDKIDQIVELYSKDLEEKAKVQIDLTEVQVSSLEERKEALNNSIELYKAKLENENLSPLEHEAILNSLAVSELELTEVDLTAYRMSSDLELYEQPHLLSTNVSPAKTYMKESIAIGLVVGLLATVVLLMLMKYLGDARKYFGHS